jgi:Holliday junction resolvase RusA-like endonuclease
MKNIILALILQFPLLIFSQQENEFISWSEKRKLVWDDFKAAPLQMGNVAALTSTHLGFSYKMSDGKVSYFIECQFEKNKSWGLVKNDNVLRHEQGHFDIAEMFARKLYKELSAYQFNRNTFQKDLDNIYKKIVDEKTKYQQLYDDETNYSQDKNNQEEWLKKIEAELVLLKTWARYN